MATHASKLAGLAQLVERWSHNPKVVSSILTPTLKVQGLDFKSMGD